MRHSVNSEKRLGILRRTAKEVRHHKVMMRILTLSLVMITIVLSTVYVTAALYKQTGSFTVSVDKYEMEEYGLTLSESRHMTHKTSHLNAKISEKITNIAEETIPNNVDDIDGVHNGDNYIAYTFYLQNGGDVTIDYEYSVLLSNVTNDLDEAIRLRLYVDGKPTTYAKVASDGSKRAEEGTEMFWSSTVMAKGRVDGFKPDAITKFTVVIWIEGNDPDCVDGLIGGELKVDMNMKVLH